MEPGYITNPPTCIFCGTHEGPFRPEDVYPKWLRNHIRVEGGVRLGRFDRWLSSQRSRHLRLLIEKGICHKRCNGGWMSEWESEIQPILAPILTNSGQSQFGPISQHALARWAVLKAWCIELAIEQRGIVDHEDVHIPLGHFHWLNDERTPPPLTRVWIGAFDPSRDGDDKYLTTHTPFPLIGVGDSKPKGQLSTFTIGHALFQVIGCDIGESPEAELRLPPQPASLATTLVQIWPYEHEAVVWPPADAVDAQHLRSIATWDGALG